MDRTPSTNDGYLAKLVKYVPAEAVVSFSAAVVLANNVSEEPEAKRLWVIVTFGLFCALAGIYFLVRSHQKPPDKRPGWYVFGLTICAFAIWAVATSDLVRRAFYISPGQAEFWLFVGALAVPLTDEALTLISKSSFWAHLRSRLGFGAARI
jgi:hypothetical protein